MLYVIFFSFQSIYFLVLVQCRARFFLFSSKQIRTVAIVNHSPRVVQLYSTLHHPPTDPRPPNKELRKRTKLNGLVLDDKVVRNEMFVRLNSIS